jgi:hypothetical protein
MNDYGPTIVATVAGLAFVAVLIVGFLAPLLNSVVAGFSLVAR